MLRAFFELSFKNFRRAAMLAAVCLSMHLSVAAHVKTQREATGPASSPQTSTRTANTASSIKTPESRITSYTLPPDEYKKSQDLSRIYLRFQLIGFAYLLFVLAFAVRWRLASKFRSAAETCTPNRFLQAFVFVPLFFMSIDLLRLPFGVYGNWLERAYGISVQGWKSWMWDWLKSEFITISLMIFLIYLLFVLIRKSPKRWWFYCWLVSLPIGLFLFFLQPLVVDPLFHKFEPLQSKDPQLTASLEKLVRHSGENIPRERMFWMGASEKSTDLNAYVTGFGSSKRIVIWDTTIAKMNEPQITFVVAHEMGHYVLNHIPKLLGFGALLLLASFYVVFRSVTWALQKRWLEWGVRDAEDYAATPVLMFSLAIFLFVTTPIYSTYERHYEHQADQYALEVTHELSPDPSQTAAQAFQILGEASYDDPNPSPVRVFLFYDHPSIPDRVQFSLHYDPWGKGELPEFVK